MGGGFSSASFAVAAFSVAAFAFDAAPVTVIPEPPKYYSVDNGAVQKAHRRQQLEEDEVILAIVQQFVMET